MRSGALTTGRQPGLWLGVAALMAAALASAACAAPGRGENLVPNGSFEALAADRAQGWSDYGEGYVLAPGEGREGGMAIRCDSADRESGHGAMHEATFDPPLKHPFVVSGWSRARDVVGGEYCLYMDCWYDDGTNLWGQQKSFGQGTHGWERIEFVFSPEKPVTRIQYFILFRGCTGTVWFDDVSLGLAPFRVEQQRVLPGLFGGNTVDLRAAFSLPARWQLSVSRAGAPVWSTSGQGKGVQVTWDGRSADGTALPGGRYDLCLEATDDLLGDALSLDLPVETPRGPGRGYAAWVESTMKRVMIGALPPRTGAAPRASVSLARQEYEGFQIALRTAPQTELRDCTVQISDLTTPGGASLASTNLRWEQVGWVEFKDVNRHPFEPEAAPGWWPDPLLPVSRFTVPPSTTQALWFTVHAPAGTAPGRYVGRVTITPANAAPLVVPVAATVYDFDVPAQPHLKTAFALMDSYLERLYPEVTPELRRAYGDYVLERKLNPDDISRTEPPDLEDIAHYNDRGLNAFNVMNMVEPRTRGNWVCWSPLEAYTPQFKADLIRRMDPYVAELKRRGLDSKAYVYTFDERGPEFWPVMREYFGLVKQRYGLPTLTTAYIPQDPDIMRDLNLDWNCPLTPVYDYEKARRCREQGFQTWAYVCCGPGYPYANWLADHPLVESRVLWWQAYHQRMDGILYWGLNIWHRANNDYLIDPETDGPRLRWSITTGGGGGDWTDRLHGDGDLLYAGKTGPLGCIRLDNIRDGLEDYEYLWLLAKLGGGVETGRAACLPVTRTMSDFSRDPAQVTRQRDRIARRIERLQRAANASSNH